MSCINDDIEKMINADLDKMDKEVFDEYLESILTSTNYTDILNLTELLKKRDIDYHSKLLVARIENVYHDTLSSVLKSTYKKAFENAMRIHRQEISIIDNESDQEVVEELYISTINKLCNSN